MECNKEEAMRAKEIAETRMANKDFVGARKIALKAQQLCPDLESISHIILVCDVHCSSQNNIFGDEKDWYSILNIDPSADESAIKKQYRKYALSLHPDKNKFSGSTDAFKLIGEAQRVLLDSNTRAIFDNKYKASKERNKSNTEANNHSSNKGFNTKNQQSGFSNEKSSFWTLCPSCCLKYRFRIDLVNKSVWCPTCKMYFVGQEINFQATSPQKKAKPIPKKWFAKGNSQHACKNSTSKRVYQENNNLGKRAREPVQTKDGSENNKKFKSSEKYANADVKSGDGDVEYRPQRCTQSKLHSYYNTRSSEVQFSKQNAPEVKTADCKFPNAKGDIAKVKPRESVLFRKSDKGNGCKKGEIEPKNYGHKSISENFLYPDPDFSNFDKYKEKECFQIGQIWAVYDTIDAMPRFYALIKDIIVPDFKVLVTWLEPNPKVESEIKWACEGLPVSCGRFKYGDSEIIEDHLMFSHLVHFEEENISDSYTIYPRKGETWAIFKNWDQNWLSDHDFKKKFEFEYVEIVSDYEEENGVFVAYLGKVKGFSCLFYEKGSYQFQLFPNQLFRFSHKVPSIKMSGEERDDVPKGSFEFDLASLPLNLEEFDIYLSESTIDKIGSLSKSEVIIQQGVSSKCLDLVFNDFNINRTKECFSVGQIWALYDSLDAMPRFYGLIEKVSFSPTFQVKLTWLEPCPKENEEIKWVNEGLPVSCGKFKLGSFEMIDDHLAFSHLVFGEKVGKKKTYRIFPRKGETWALFKNWNINWNSNLESKTNYKFVIVEILTDYDAHIGVSVAYLGKVKGFPCLFEQKNEIKSFKIHPNHKFRFSHKVPSFRINSDEHKDVRKGSFDLDPDSLPIDP